MHRETVVGKWNRNLKGKKGWLDNSKKNSSDKTCVNVIVEEVYGDGIVEECQTWVKVWSYADPLGMPATPLDALMQIHPDIELGVANLCRILAKCGITDESFAKTYEGDFFAHFTERMAWATRNQQAPGHKALYRRGVPKSQMYKG